jgi:hypothetical protein
MRTKPAAAYLVGLGAVLLIVMGLGERLMGREFLSDAGFGVWTGAWTRATSQWVADPYTFTHVLHGVFFYWLLLIWRARLSLRWRYAIAGLLEAGWEMLENSPFVIDRYRTATAALDYYGDSILNSGFDLIAALLGAWLASKVDWKWMLLLVVAIELGCLYFVRDNLTLNILMLICPSEAIKQWQLRG